MTLCALLAFLVLFNMVIIVRSNIVKLRAKSRIGKIKKHKGRVLIELNEAISTIEAARLLNQVVNSNQKRKLRTIEKILKKEAKQV